MPPPGLNVPGPQLVHEPALPSEVDPGGHDRHVDAFAGAYCPPGHEVQTAFPLPGPAAVPGPQVLHPAAPGVLVDPGGHGVHVGPQLPAAQNVPAAQVVHVTDVPAALYCPGPQLLHELAPELGPAYVPAGHTLQFPQLPAAHIVPDGQLVHVMDVPALLYWPGPQS